MARYRDYKHQRPELGAKLPAFVVAEYEDGSALVFSHGAFDVWCVYHAKRIGNEGGSNAQQAARYPLMFDSVTVARKIGGGVTDFAGTFETYASGEFVFGAPKDVEYLGALRDFGMKYGEDEAWSMFMELYETIPQERDITITNEMLETVRRLAQKYSQERDLRLTLDCLLCAMIAENNRLMKYGSPYNTKLGKKVKALGAHQAIYEKGLTLEQVADFSKNKSVGWISDQCAQRGINTENIAG